MTQSSTEDKTEEKLELIENLNRVVNRSVVNNIPFFGWIRDIYLCSKLQKSLVRQEGVRDIDKYVDSPHFVAVMLELLGPVRR